MNADEVQKLLKVGRSAQVDWVAADAAQGTLASLLVAMANSQGGVLVIGVSSAGTLTSLRDSEAAIDRVLQAALAVEPPLIIPLPKAVKVGQKEVVVVHIPPGMPHVYALDGRYLYRKGYENAPLNPRELRRLMMERGELSFETEALQGGSIEDIDWDKAEAYAAGLRGMRETDARQVLLKRGCLIQERGKLRPTHAGILLFGKDPQRFLPGAEIIAVRFAGEEMSDTFTRQDIVGTLPEQIRRAETFLVDNLRKDVQLGAKMERREYFEYPLEAARELIVNAVAHRNYSISGDSIRTLIFGNRMEVHSPGGLPGPVTIANIKDERFSRNPAIVQVLADLGFIERLGYGVDRVIELMRQQQLRAPEFQERAGGFKVVLYNQPGDDDDSEKGAPEISGQYRGVAVNPRQEAALVYLQTEGNARITNGDLQALCPDVHPETIRRDLADLVTKNILRKMGEKRGSYYVLNQE
ncbi:MAG: putative DNA binding domain-containing protein [Chloroflexi bacterium]|nr:putative DNA binding domain-containing protein [Chloroflexota bacterium]